MNREEAIAWHQRMTLARQAPDNVGADVPTETVVDRIMMAFSHVESAIVTGEQNAEYWSYHRLKALQQKEEEHRKYVREMITRALDARAIPTSGQDHNG